MNCKLRIALGVILAFGSISVLGQSQSTHKVAPKPLSPEEKEAQMHYRIALEALKNNDLVAAQQELTQASALAPKNALIWYNLAVVESKSNDPQSAMKHLQKAIDLGMPAAMKDDANDLKAKLTYAIRKQSMSSTNSNLDTAKTRQPSADEPTTPSIWETLDYLNSRVDSSFVPKDTNYLLGRFSVDQNRTTLWWSRWRSEADTLRTRDLDGRFWFHSSATLGGCIYGVEAHSGALVVDLNPEATSFDQKSSDEEIACKHKDCWSFWTQCADADFRQSIGRMNTKSEKAQLTGNLTTLIISTSGDPELGENFARALRHLIRLMQALPQNQNMGPKDPFAQ